MEGEQHFILRVQNPELAERLRRWLRDSENIEEVRLLFDTADDRVGSLTVDGVQHMVSLQDLPAVVEAYKTLDDANLVKVADIGQVLLVVDEQLGAPDTYAAPDGVTPPMRQARRHFKPPIVLPPAHMKQAVNDVLEMLQGKAPDGYTFQDIEEEYVIDSADGQGKWVPVKPSKQQRVAAAAAADAPANKPARGGRGAAKRKKASDDDDDYMSEGSD